MPMSPAITMLSLAMRILVDADACPVKEEIYRVARRYRLEVILVANTWLRLPGDAGFRLVQVKEGADAADDWIVANLQAGDIVITADILLASRCLPLAWAVLSAGGEPFTDDTIGSAVATRALLAELRDSGIMSAGSGTFQPRDRSRFLQQLDKTIQAGKRRFGVPV